MQKKVSFISLVSSIFSACTGEPDLHNFDVSIKNATNASLTLLAFNKNEFLFQDNLNNDENSQSCIYSDENFRGYYPNFCNVDSMVIKFSTNRGYISTSSTFDDFSFSNKRNPLLPNGGFENINDTYEFLVTQEDYENAHELPE
ncbi:hypothetical protein [Flagellimonas sp.]|uniref:hypothetical protein n=1 Tax=Flagellimonas sp. TaxID=2058762 RepID=UPI003B5B2947